tara:strand:- start:2834 stop:4504 length:1671 start_codon:yes stop_codon:yes gene_type:complete
MERLELQQQLRQITNLSLPRKSTSGIFAKKSQRDITPQMVQDFKLKEAPPPFLKPDIDLDITQVYQPFPDANLEDIDDLEEERKKSADDINELLDELTKTNIQVLELEIEYNNTFPTLITEKARREYSKAFSAEMENLRDINTQIKKDIEKQRGNIIGKASEIENIKAYVKENEKVKNEILKTNRYNLKRYEDGLKLLNRGYIVEQGIEESDEDYKNRLEALQQNDSVIEAQITLKNIDDFKQSMLDLYPSLPLYIVEKLQKYFKGKGEDYEIIKRFSEVKRKFLITFGTNPMFKKPYEEMKEFLDVVFLTGIEDILEEQASTDFSDDVKRFVDIDFDVIANGKIDKDLEGLTNEKLGEIFKTQLKTSKASIRANSPQNPTRFKVITQPKKDQLQRVITFLRRERGMKGKGIARDIPTIASFGEIMINPYALFYKNKVSLRNKLNANIYGLRDKIVSDELRDNLLSIYNKKQPIHRLTDEDQIYYDAIISKANLERETPSDKTNSIEKLKRRMTVLEGSLSAGNDNVKGEILDTLKQLVNLGAIGEKSAMSYFKGL